MEARDPATRQIHEKLVPAIGEPEATLLADRLIMRDEIRAIVREELAVVEERLEARLEAKIQSSARQQTLHFIAIMTFLNGMLGGILTLALR